MNGAGISKLLHQPGHLSLHAKRRGIRVDERGRRWNRLTSESMSGDQADEGAVEAQEQLS